MANDITGINSSRSQQAGDRTAVGAKKDSSDSSQSSSSTSSPSRDKLSLTDTAGRLKALEHQLAQQPEINKTRVDEVQNKLSNGDYEVNPERVADKMMAFESAIQDKK